MNNACSTRTGSASTAGCRRMRVAIEPYALAVARCTGGGHNHLQLQTERRCTQDGGNSEHDFRTCCGTHAKRWSRHCQTFPLIAASNGSRAIEKQRPTHYTPGTQERGLKTTARYFFCNAIICKPCLECESISTRLCL